MNVCEAPLQDNIGVRIGETPWGNKSLVSIPYGSGNFSSVPAIIVRSRKTINSKFDPKTMHILWHIIIAYIHHMYTWNFAGLHYLFWPGNFNFVECWWFTVDNNFTLLLHVHLPDCHSKHVLTQTQLRWYAYLMHVPKAATWMSECSSILLHISLPKVYCLSHWKTNCIIYINYLAWIPHKQSSLSRLSSGTWQKVSAQNTASL